MSCSSRDRTTEERNSVTHTLPINFSDLIPSAVTSLSLLESNHSYGSDVSDFVSSSVYFSSSSSLFILLGCQQFVTKDEVYSGSVFLIVAFFYERSCL